MLFQGPSAVVRRELRGEEQEAAQAGWCLEVGAQVEFLWWVVKVMAHLHVLSPSG